MKTRITIRELEKIGFKKEIDYDWGDVWRLHGTNIKYIPKTGNIYYTPLELKTNLDCIEDVITLIGILNKCHPKCKNKKVNNILVFV